MQNALLAAQKTCDQMVADAEKKCAQMLHEAEDAASAKTNNVDALVGEEQERLDAAKTATSQFLDGMEKRLKRQLELIDELRRETPLTPSQPEEPERVHRFTPPVEQKPHIYSMELEFIHLYDTPGNEVIRDQVRYVSADPYGLDNAQEVMLYCPGAKLADLPEYFLLWTNQGPKEEVGPEDTLSFYGLYNVNESEGFAGHNG